MTTSKPRKAQPKRKPKKTEKPQDRQKRLERTVANSAYRDQERAYVRKDGKPVSYLLTPSVANVSDVRRAVATLTKSKNPEIKHLTTISRRYEVVEGAITSAARIVAKLIGHPWLGFRLSPGAEVILRVAEKHGFLAGGMPTAKLYMLESLAPMYVPIIQEFLTDIGNELRSDAHRKEVKRRRAVVSDQIESGRRMFDRLADEGRPLIAHRVALYSARPVIVGDDNYPKIVEYDHKAATSALMVGRKRLVKRLGRASFYPELAGFVMTTDMTVFGGPAIIWTLFFWDDLGEKGGVRVADIAAFAQQISPEFIDFHDCKNDKNPEMGRGVGRIDPTNRHQVNNVYRALQYLAIRDSVMGLDHAESRRYWVSNRLQPDGKRQAEIRGRLIAETCVSDQKPADFPSKADARALRNHLDDLQGLPVVCPDDLEFESEQWLAKVDGEAIDRELHQTRQALVIVEDQITERRRLDALKAAKRNQDMAVDMPNYSEGFGASVDDRSSASLAETSIEQESLAESDDESEVGFTDALQLHVADASEALSSDQFERLADYGRDELAHTSPVKSRSAKVKITIKPAGLKGRAVVVAVSNAKRQKLKSTVGVDSADD